MVRVGGLAALLWLAATGTAAASGATLTTNGIDPIELRLRRIASDPMTGPEKRFTAWIGGNGAKLSNREPGLRSDFQEVTAGGGIDYRLLDQLTLGVGLLHLDTHVDLFDSFGRFDRVGWIVAPYMAWSPISYVTLWASGGGGNFENTAATGAGGLGRFDSDQIFGMGGLSFDYPIGNWRTGVFARYLWARSESEAYTTTAGTSLDKFKQTTEQGRAIVSLGYDFGGFKPFVFGGAEHEFDNRRVVFVGARLVRSDDTGLVFGGGIDFALAPFRGTLRYTEEAARDRRTNGAGPAKRLELSLELPF